MRYDRSSEARRLCEKSRQNRCLEQEEDYFRNRNGHMDCRQLTFHHW